MIIQVTHLDANMEDFDEAFGPNSPIGKLKRKLTQGRSHFIAWGKRVRLHLVPTEVRFTLFSL
jgi:hypothetical protein